MSPTRFRPSFSRQPCISATIALGTSAGSAVQSGSPLMTDANTTATSSPPNAGLAVSISNSTQPKAQMSTRLSTALPRACSGAMYAAVPSNTPTPVTIAGEVIVGDIDNGDGPVAGAIDVSASLAKPKSSTLTVPSGRTLIFAGFRSL